MNSLDVRKEYACARPFSRALHLDSFQQPAKNILFTKRATCFLVVDRRTQVGAMEWWSHGVMLKTQHSSSPVLQHSILRLKYHSPMSFFILAITSGGCTITSFAKPSSSCPLISSGSSPFFLASATKSGWFIALA
jgi:hypothetical protein